MNEQEHLELGRLINALMAERLGAPEGSEYVNTIPEGAPLAPDLPEGVSIQEMAESFVNKMLSIMNGDFND